MSTTVTVGQDIHHVFGYKNKTQVATQCPIDDTKLFAFVDADGDLTVFMGHAAGSSNEVCLKPDQAREFLQQALNLIGPASE